MQEYKYMVPQNVTKNSIIVLHIFLAGLSISWLLKITPLQSSCVASSGHIWQLTNFCRNAFFCCGKDEEGLALQYKDKKLGELDQGWM